MSGHGIAGMLALLIAGGVAAAPEPAVPGTRREAQADWAQEGLQAQRARGLDLVYVRPGATLTGYQGVLIRPVAVHFRKHWLRDQEMAKRMRLRDRDVQAIKDRLAAVVQQEMAAELGRSGLRVVDRPGEGVLDLALSIVELDVTASDLPVPGRVETYAVSAGEMSLVGELRDAATGAIAMRLFDRASAYETRWPHRITMVETVAEQRNAARAWARALARQMRAAGRGP